MTKGLLLVALCFSTISSQAQVVDTTGTARYVLEEGDTLFELATRLGISVRSLEMLNPDALAFVKAGSTYRIPADKMSKSYTVKRGDTLFGLSRQFRVSVDRIKEANNMSGTGLNVGDRMNIPGQGVQPNLGLNELNTDTVLDAIAVVTPEMLAGHLMSTGHEYDATRFSISHPNFPIGSIVWVKKSDSERGTFAEVTERGFSEEPLLVDISGAVADFLELEPDFQTRIQIRLIYEANK